MAMLATVLLHADKHGNVHLTSEGMVVLIFAAVTVVAFLWAYGSDIRSLERKLERDRDA